MWSSPALFKIPAVGSIKRHAETVVLQISFLKALFPPWKSINSLNFRGLLYPWICAISSFPKDGKCSTLATSWEVSLAHCSPLQPPDSEAWPCTQEKKGPRLYACLQQDHNEHKDGSQLEHFMPDISMFVMVTEVHMQQGGDSSKSLNWRTECRVVFPQHDLTFNPDLFNLLLLSPLTFPCLLITP